MSEVDSKMKELEKTSTEENKSVFDRLVAEIVAQRDSGSFLHSKDSSSLIVAATLAKEVHKTVLEWMAKGLSEVNINYGENQLTLSARELVHRNFLEKTNAE